MGGNLPTSWRFPFNLTGKVHYEAENAIRYVFSGVKDLNDAIRSLNNKVSDNTKAIASQAAASGGTVVVTPTTSATATHSEPLTDGNSNFIFAGGDIVVCSGVPD